MGDYYDSKGMAHSTEWGCNIANQKYLSEERSARDKQTELLEQQARLQAQYLRLAEQRERQQRVHNERVEALAREEAAEAQAQRDFTKDVQWLERSDAKGRFDYLLRKRKSDIVERLAGLAFAKSFLEQCPIAPQKRSGLRSALTDYCDASLAYSNTASELDEVKWGLASAKEAAGTGFLAKPALFLAVITVLAVFGMLGESNGNIEKVTGGVVGILLFLWGPLALYAKCSAASKKAKQASAQEAELTLLQCQVQQRLETRKHECLQKRDSARVVFVSWQEENAAILCATVQNAIRDGLVSERLKALIGEVEKEFPPLLRVDWSAVDVGFLRGSANELADDILESAVGRYVRPDLLVVQLTVSGEEQLIAKLRSNPSLLADVGDGDQHALDSDALDSDSSTVMLMAVPQDKKSAVIMAIREVKPGLGLAEATDLVESAPTEVLENVTTAEAQQAGLVPKKWTVKRVDSFSYY